MSNRTSLPSPGACRALHGRVARATSQGLLVLALAAGPGCQRGFSTGSDAVAPERTAAVPQAAPAPAPQSPVPAAGQGAEVTISGQLTLTPALRHAAAAGDTIFVSARAADDRRMLAVTRLFVADPPHWPLTFQLVDARLQAGTRACLSARIDKDGDATTRGPGDVVAERAEPVAAPMGDVVLTFDQPL